MNTQIFEMTRTDLARMIESDPIGALNLWKPTAASTASRSFPDYMLPGIARYILLGVIPGGFLRAVFESDLVGAATRADLDNLKALPQYGVFLAMYCPTNAYGSAAKVEAWHVRGGMRGTEEVTA